MKAELVPTFVDLLKDSEGEVRTAAAGEVPGKEIMSKGCLWNLSTDKVLLIFGISGFAKFADKQTILESFLPCIRELVEDGNQHVRAALALHISGLSPILGKEE